MHPLSPIAPSLEERKLSLDERMRDAELRLREREVAALERDRKYAKWSSPTSLALIAATLGLLGNIFVASVNNRAQREVEKMRHESTLILEAIKTGNAKAACTNLQLFVRLALLSDSHGKIETCDHDPSFAYLPSSSDSEALLEAQQAQELDSKHFGDEGQRIVIPGNKGVNLRYFPSDGCVYIIFTSQAGAVSKWVCPPYPRLTR